MNAVSVAIIGALGTALGALGVFLVNVRRLSGQIKTSEASELWSESRAIREDYARRLANLQQMVDSQRERIDNLENRNWELTTQNFKLHERIRELEGELHGQ